MRRRWVWVLLGAVLLVWAGFTVYLVVRPRFDYEPIGDPLFDRTALWVLEQHAAHSYKPGLIAMLFNPRRTAGNPHRDVSFSALLSWQDSFRDDPRFWQLLIQAQSLGMAVTEGRYFPPSEADPPLTDTKFAEELQRGICDPSSFTLVDWTGWTVRDEDLALALADQAIGLDPGNSYFYYRKAGVLQALGELHSAWEQVKLGNAAERNCFPIAFPQSVLQSNWSSFRTDDSRIAATLLWTDSSIWQLAHDQSFTEICAACALGMPVGWADDWVVYARRMAQQENQRLENQLMAAQFARKLVGYVSEECLGLDQRQAEERDAILQALTDIGRDASALRSRFQAPTGLLGPVSILAVRTSVVPEMWDDIKLEMEQAESNRAAFDILDPPPFAIWARGELVGLDTSGVAQSGEDGAEAP